MGPEMEESKYRIALFDGNGFNNWKFRMEVLLEEHNLIDCVRRQISEIPELQTVVTDTAAQIAQKNNLLEARKSLERKCKSMIVQRIADSHLEYVKDKQTPKEIWSSLNSTFERKGVAGQLYLRKKLLTMKLAEGVSLEKHFLEFDKTVRDLKSTGATVEELDAVCHLLLTLSTSYDPVVTALETINDTEILTMQFVRGRLLDEEIKRNGKENSEEGSKLNSTAFVGSSNSNYPCYKCGRLGHTRSECRWKKPKYKKNKKGKKDQKEHAEVAFLTKVGDGSTTADQKWYLDSGASDHMVKNREFFETLEKLENPITVGVAKEGEEMLATHCGIIRAVSTINSKMLNCVIEGVLFVPRLRVNLFSVKRLDNAGMWTLIENNAVKVGKGKEIFATGKLTDRLYEMDFVVKQPEATAEITTEVSTCKVGDNFLLWHKRLSHLGSTNLRLLAKGTMVKGMEIKLDKAEAVNVCESCIGGKQNRSPFCKERYQRSSRPLELVHSDVCGPINPPTWDNQRYFISFIDDYTHFTMIYLMNTKSEVISRFQEYEALAAAHFERKISRLRCDNGGEYTSDALRKFCKEKGIAVEYTIAYTPQQNGVSERMNRTLIEKARSVIIDSKLDKRMWGEAVLASTYTTNRSPCSSLKEEVTPCEMWTGKKPDISNLRVFGSVAHTHIPKEQRRKLDAKSKKLIMVGYSTKGYRLWDAQNRKIVYSRDVIFEENPKEKNPKEENRKEENPKEEIQTDFYLEETPVDGNDGKEDQATEIEQALNDEPGNDGNDGQAQAEEPEGDQEEGIDRNLRTKRIRRPPTRFPDYDMAYLALVAGSFTDDVPNNLQEVHSRADRRKWEEAIESELDSLRKNDTWALTELPKGHKAIQSKWIFKIKRNEDGNIKKYKARVVAKGFSQRKGFDYNETFAPVARMTTVRIMLAVTNHLNLHAHQMDVKTAFLNGKLDEEIYMVPPEGVNAGNKVWKLQKPLYGLKQAPKCWNERLNGSLLKFGFKRSKTDYCLYTKVQEDSKIYIVIYVDDLLITGDNLVQINDLKRRLMEEFEMVDEGELRHYLGLKITRDRERKILTIQQKQYIEDVLEKFGMKDSLPISTPMEVRLNLPSPEENNTLTGKPYRELIGSIMYTMLSSRPDISASVNFLSKFQNCATEQHWNYLKRILRYLKGTIDHKLVYQVNPEKETLVGYADADWANDTGDRKSISGYVFKLFNAAVSWGTRKQPSVTLSSTEAEYVAVTEAVREALWIQGILKDLGITCEKPTTIFEDNQACIEIAKHPQEQKRMKHVDVKYHFIRDEIAANNVRLKYIPTKEQLADVFTKGLPAKQFIIHRENLGIRNIKLRGDVEK